MAAFTSQKLIIMLTPNTAKGHMVRHANITLHLHCSGLKQGQLHKVELYSDMLS